MEPSPLYPELDRLISEPEGVTRLLQRMNSDYLPWDVFLAMRLPAELSPLESWALLKRLAAAIAITFPIHDLEGTEFWYLRTHKIADAVARVQCRCRTDSSLYRDLMTARNRSVLVKSRIEETIAAAHLDGMGISEKAAASLLKLDRAPRNDVERVVKNTLSALDHIEDFVDEPFSADLFHRLRDLVIEGVDLEALPEAPPRLGVIRREYGHDAVGSARMERQLDAFADYANHATGDVHDHPIVRALLLPDVFRYYRPLPDMNSQVGRLVFRLYAIKAGLPMLGMLPLSRLKLDWEEDRIPRSRVPLDRQRYTASVEYDGADLTGWVTLSMQLAVTALEDIEQRLADLQAEDDELRDLLQHDVEINHRQRSILGRALRNPSAEFRIAYHKTKHNVVYATARADLMELAEKGLLEIDKDGRAMVFRPRPGLRQFIESRYATE